MKVCTDACLFGAWVADKYRRGASPAHTLDIGAGTGLLSLMLARQFTGSMEAIEIDEAAALQCRQNIEAAGKQNEIIVVHSSLQDFKTSHQYNLIISNPPFFENDLHSPDNRINAAKHNNNLTLDELIVFIKHNLATDGMAAIMLPFHRCAAVKEAALKNKIYVHEIVYVRQTSTHNYFRCFFILTMIEKDAIVESDITIKNAYGAYTPEFAYLLKDYYLQF